MLKNSPPEAGFSNSRLLLSVFLCLSGIFLTVLSFARAPREIADLAKRKNSIVAKPTWRGPIINPTQTTTSNSSGPGWSIVTSPNQGADKWNLLTDVACVLANDCWSFGAHRNDSGFDQTLAEHWDGKSWSIVSTPNAGTSHNELFRVICVSTSDCWATGSYVDANLGVRQTLIEHWDGNTWSIVPSPNNGSVVTYLEGAACISSDDCWAVGFYGSGNLYGSGGSYQTLIEHWDGNTWSIVPSPNGGQINRLGDVTCISSSDCWAVGGKEASASTPLIEHWDGVSWSIVAAPTANTSTHLSSIKCTSSSQCWAVGDYYTGSGDPFVLTSSQTLIEQWDGISWSVVSSANPGTMFNSFSTVACTLAADCWAVGRYENAAGPSGGTGGTKTLVEHWDGNAWSITPSPNPASGFDGNLVGVACTAASQCFSVGQFVNNSFVVSQTLVEEYSPNVPPLIKAGSRMTHGTTGTFYVDLPLTGKRGVECRSGGANGNYSVAFTFVNAVTNCGTTNVAGATIVAGPNSNQCTVNLTGVANAQYLTLELDNVIDAQNNTGNIAVQMGVLIGDTNADGFVDAIDVSQTKSQSGNAVRNSNFREDINLDGFVDAIDASFVKSKSGTSLPSSP